jgi:hypothetical protein
MGDQNPNFTVCFLARSDDVALGNFQSFFDALDFIGSKRREDYHLTRPWAKREPALFQGRSILISFPSLNV